MTIFDIDDMDETSFILGFFFKAKVICWAGRRLPRVTHDGTRELVSVIECCGSGRMIPPVIMFKGQAGIELEGNGVDQKTHFAYSQKGYTSDVLASLL